MRKTGLALAAALLLAGCAGSDSPPRQATRPTTTTTSTGPSSASAGTATSTAPGGHGASSGGGAAAPGATTTPQPGGPSNAIPLSASLGASCVRAGTSQAITIKSLPEAGVAYDAIYADGRTGAEYNGYGGNNGGVTDKTTGEWKDTWVVGAAAPPGPVKVQVVGAKSGVGRGETLVTFTVVAPTGRCP